MKALRISGSGLSPDWNCLYVKINLASFRDKSSGVPQTSILEVKNVTYRAPEALVAISWV